MTRLPIAVALFASAVTLCACGSMNELEDENIALRARVDSLETARAEFASTRRTLDERISALEKENLRLNDQLHQHTSTSVPPSKAAPPAAVPPSKSVPRAVPQPKSAPSAIVSPSKTAPGAAVPPSKSSRPATVSPSKSSPPAAVPPSKSSPPAAVSPSKSSPPAGVPPSGKPPAPAQARSTSEPPAPSRPPAEVAPRSDQAVPPADRRPRQPYVPPRTESVPRVAPPGYTPSTGYAPSPGANRMAQAPVSTDFLSRYQAALDDYHERRYARAVDAFSNLVTAYPASTMTDNCQFWLGSALAAQGNDRAAMQWFDVVIGTQGSNKRADALLERGDILRRLGDDGGARRDFEAVASEYPGGTASDAAHARLRAMR